MRARGLAALAASALLVGCGGSPAPVAGTTADAEGGETARYRAAAPQGGSVITSVNEIGPSRYAVKTTLAAGATDQAMALCQEIAGKLDPLPGMFVVRDGSGNIAVTWNHPRLPGECATA